MIGQRVANLVWLATAGVFWSIIAVGLAVDWMRTRRTAPFALIDTYEIRTVARVADVPEPPGWDEMPAITRRELDTYCGECLCEINAVFAGVRTFVVEGGTIERCLTHAIRLDETVRLMGTAILDGRGGEYALVRPAWGTCADDLAEKGVWN